MKLIEHVEGLVVVLIDMQYGFLGKEKIKEKKIDTHIITHQAEVLRFCQKTNTPVIVVESAWPILGRTICPLLSIVEKIPRYRYVHKTRNSAFSATEFKQYLDEFAAMTLLLMGVNADACIFDTARSAVDRSYTVITSDTLMSGYCSYKEEERKKWYEETTTYHSTQMIS